ncbi:unnamed protein product, partial [Polarella glacialis]
VAVDNSATKGLVFNNEAEVPASQIDSVTQEQKLTSFASAISAAPAQSQAQNRGYLPGDPLKVHFAISQADGTVLPMQGSATLQQQGIVEAVAELRLRTPDAYGACRPGEAVRFMTDVPASSCWLGPLDLASQCTSTLSPRLQLGSWMLRSAQLPEDSRCRDRCVTVNFNSSCPVRTVASGSVLDSLEACPSGQGPTLADPVLQTSPDGSCTCVGALRDASLSFQWGYDATQGAVVITKVDVLYTLQNVTSPGCQPLPILQSTSALFVQQQTGDGLVEARSGNPGYVTGLPLLVARCLDYAQGSTSCVRFGPRAEAAVEGIRPAGTCAFQGNASTTRI